MNEGVIYFTKLKEDSTKKHLEHMTGERLLETGLRREYGCELSKEPRGRGEHGKPFLALRPDIHYNISHSGKYVVCILAGEEVGIDIQIHKKANYWRMLERIMPPDKIRELLEGERPVEAFFARWVLCEAYIKWTGEGLSRDLRTVNPEEGFYTFLELEEGYSGAVYARNPMELRYEYVDIEWT